MDIRFKRKLAFTLVELIVVVTILSILSTIGFVSYSSYLSGVRDTNRISQLKAIGDSLHLYRTKGSLPIPDDKIDITVGTGTLIIAYQGYVGKNIIETIGYTAEGKDPKNDNYFSYYLTKNKKYFQLMSFLEEKQETTTNLKTNDLFAIDYEVMYPYTEGNKLGILTDSVNTPIQEIDSIKAATKFNINNVGVSEYKSYLEGDEILVGSGVTFSKLKDIAEVGGRGWRVIGNRLVYKNLDGGVAGATTTSTATSTGITATTTSTATTTGTTSTATTTGTTTGTTTATTTGTTTGTTTATTTGTTATSTATTTATTATATSTGTTATTTSTATSTGTTATTTSTATATGTTATSTGTIIAADWRNVDSNCDIADITIGTQVWAGCNSTIGIGEEYSGSCYDYNGNSGISCSNTQNLSSAKENAWNSTYGINNIWGKLYTFPNSSSACTNGYHVPSDAEWTTLENTLNGSICRTLVGRQCDGLGWAGHTAKTSSNNLVQALKLPLAGIGVASFQWRGLQTNLWTSTSNSPGYGKARVLSSSFSGIDVFARGNGIRFSVRCIKN